jgi:hypothetical protein
MSFMTVGQMGGRKNEFDQNIQMVPNGSPPAYDYAIQDDRDPPWFDVRYWSKRTLILSALALVIVIVIAVAVAVVEVKKNAYPDYSKLNYSLVDQCMIPSTKHDNIG